MEFNRMAGIMARHRGESPTRAPAQAREEGVEEVDATMFFFKGGPSALMRTKAAQPFFGPKIRHDRKNT